MSKTKIASIDIGSNTVLLLIAEIDFKTGNLKTVLNEYSVPRISDGLGVNNSIKKEKISLLIEILNNYKLLAKENNVHKIIVTATNALRIANNTDYIIKAVQSKTELNINVISGIEEAQLSYLGARSSFQQFERAFVLDIGGGSTEVIYGTSNNILFRKSFPFGAVSLKERFVSKYPLIKSEFNELSTFIEDEFAELNDLRNPDLPLIALAGTPTTLSCINQNIKEYDDELVEGSILTKTQTLKMIRDFKDLIPEEIKSEYGNVVDGREDVILAGSQILLTVMDVLEQQRIYVSSRGLRYGAIIKFISNLQ